MRDQHESNRKFLPQRIPPALVIELGTREVEPVPGSDRPSIELEEPQTEPATLERKRREFTVERLLSPDERNPSRAPARAVEREENCQVCG